MTPSPIYAALRDYRGAAIMILFWGLAIWL